MASVSIYLNFQGNMFWGAYWGTCLDKFGIRWMFNFMEMK